MKYLALLVVFCVLSSLCAWTWTEVVLYSENTPYLHTDWRVEKRVLEMGVMGGDSFVITRSGLAGNSLHLERWFGFHELTYQPRLDPVEVRFRFRLNENAHLTFFWGKNQKAHGLRFSRNSLHPTAYLDLGSGGEFRGKIILGETISQGWHEAILKLAGSETIVSVDQKELGRVSLSFSSMGQIGFRGSLADADVDDLVIVEKNGQTLTESFANRRGFFPLLILNLCSIVVLFMIALGGVGWQAGRLALREVSLLGSLCLTTASICGGLYLGFDSFFWSHLALDPMSQPLKGEATDRIEIKIERLRESIFSLWYRFSGGEVIEKNHFPDRGYPLMRVFSGPIQCVNQAPCNVFWKPEEAIRAVREPAKGFRLLFVGTSQTVGSGASRLEETFFAETHRALVERPGQKFKLESLNISVSGSSSQPMFEEFRTKFSAFKPDLMVINLANNDDVKDLEVGLAKFLELNHRLGIDTVLLKEANSLETDHEGFRRNLLVVQSVADSFQVPVLDLNGFVNELERSDRGFVWWDFVHLTSYAQKQVALWLAPQLKRSIDKRRNR